MSASGNLTLSGTTLIGSGSLTDAGQLAGNFSLGLSSTTMSSGSAMTVNGVAVQPGAVLAINSNSSVTITDSAFLSVSGQMTLSGDSLVVDKTAGCCGTSDGIVVNLGGTLTLKNSSVSRNGGSGYESSYLTVSAGGHLITSNTTFSLDDLYLNAGVVLNSGDMTGNIFNSPLYAPIADQPLLTNNQSFGAVYLTGSLNSSQSLSLDPIGTGTTTGQYYILPGGLATTSSQSLTIENNAVVYIADSQFLSVGGPVKVTNATVVIDKNAGCCGTSDGIVVNQGGTMTLNNASIYRNGGSGYETSSISVNAGGHLVSSNTSSRSTTSTSTPASSSTAATSPETSSTPPSTPPSPTSRC